jgi:hypothetical protein
MSIPSPSLVLKYQDLNAQKFHSNEIDLREGIELTTPGDAPMDFFMNGPDILVYLHVLVLLPNKLSLPVALLPDFLPTLSSLFCVTLHVHQYLLL